MRRGRAVSARGLEQVPAFSRATPGPQEAGVLGLPRLAGYGTPTAGPAFARFPSRRAASIILTDDDRGDARAIARRIAERTSARR